MKTLRSMFDPNRDVEEVPPIFAWLGIGVLGFLGWILANDVARRIG